MAGGFLLAYQLFSMSIFAALNKSELVQTGIMREIQMVDLVAQYAHIQEEIDAAVLGVIRSAKYIGGPEVDSFKKEFEILDSSGLVQRRNGAYDTSPSLLSILA
jgi:hypothetical protein